MAMEKNKVKFGLNRVHWAKILSYDENGMPVYARSGCPALYRSALTQAAKMSHFLPIIACIICATTIPDMRGIWRLPS